MAGEKLKICTKFNASTILEVVVSMVIILLVFSIAMTIFANVTRASISTKEMNARTILNDLLIDVEKNADYTPKEVTIGDLRIQQDFKPRTESPSLVEINLAAVDINQHKVAEVKKIVIKVNE